MMAGEMVVKSGGLARIGQGSGTTSDDLRDKMPEIARAKAMAKIPDTPLPGHSPPCDSSQWEHGGQMMGLRQRQWCRFGQGGYVQGIQMETGQGG